MPSSDSFRTWTYTRPRHSYRLCTACFPYHAKPIENVCNIHSLHLHVVGGAGEVEGGVGPADSIRRYYGQTHDLLLLENVSLKP